MGSKDPVALTVEVLLGEAQEEAEAAPVADEAPLPLIDGQLLTVRVTVPVTLTEGQPLVVRLTVPVALEEGEMETENVADTDTQLVLLLLGVAQEDGENVPVDDRLLLPLDERLPLGVRVTVTVPLVEGEEEMETEVVKQGLPLNATLAVGGSADPVTLVVLLLLEVAQEEAEAAPVNETLPLPLIDGLPLAVRVTVSVTLTDGQPLTVRLTVPVALVEGEKETESVADTDTQLVLLLLGVAHEEAEVAPVKEALPLPLIDGLPLAVRVTVSVTLTDGQPLTVRLTVPVALVEGEKETESVADTDTQLVLLLLGVAQDDGEKVPVDDRLLLPLKEGLPLGVRVTVPVTLVEGEEEMETEVVKQGLPLNSALAVGGSADPVTLVVLLRLGVAQEEEEAAPVKETLPLPLIDGLPLAVRVTVSVTLTDGQPLTVRLTVPVELEEGEKDTESVADPDTQLVLLLLGVAQEDGENAAVEETLPLPLDEGQPLTVRVTVIVELGDGEKEVEGVSVPCGLPVDAPLPEK